MLYEVTPLTAVICYLNQAIIPICTVTTLIYPPLLTTIRGAYFPRLTKSRWGMPARRAPDRLAALLTAFRLVYRVLPAPDFHRREHPNLPAHGQFLFYRRVRAVTRIIGSILTDWWDEKESNLRRAGLQPAALPTELSSHSATHFCLSALHRTA